MYLLLSYVKSFYVHVRFVHLIFNQFRSYFVIAGYGYLSSQFLLPGVQMPSCLQASMWPSLKNITHHKILSKHIENEVVSFKTNNAHTHIYTHAHKKSIPFHHDLLDEVTIVGNQIVTKWSLRNYTIGKDGSEEIAT